MPFFVFIRGAILSGLFQYIVRQAQDSVLCHLVTEHCQLKNHPKTQYLTSLFYLFDNPQHYCISNAMVLLQSLLLQGCNVYIPAFDYTFLLYLTTQNGFHVAKIDT